jgi:hypothetical protein
MVQKISDIPAPQVAKIKIHFILLTYWVTTKIGLKFKPRFFRLYLDSI